MNTNMNPKQSLWNLKILMTIFLLTEQLLAASFSFNKISMKIVSQMPNIENGFGPARIGLNEYEIDSSTTLRKEREEKLVLNPAPFSGPEQLRKLVGACFTYVDEKYKFRFCPFNNVTQEEIQAFQEPYKGILGVWGEWIIKNNSFVALHFILGAKCGLDEERTVKVNLSCGSFSHLISINEPTKCSYEGVFETPLVCGKNSLLVYPRLPKELQLEWDKIETEKHYEILTEKGYEAELERIFLDAGYIISADAKRKLYRVNDSKLKCDTSLRYLEERVKQLGKEIETKDILIRNLTDALERRKI